MTLAFQSFRTNHCLPWLVRWYSLKGILISNLWPISYFRRHLYFKAVSHPTIVNIVVSDGMCISKPLYVRLVVSKGACILNLHIQLLCVLLFQTPLVNLNIPHLSSPILSCRHYHFIVSNPSFVCFVVLYGTCIGTFHNQPLYIEYFITITR